MGSLYISYNLTYLRRLGEWEGWSQGLLVITATWLSISYLSGRYSLAETKGKNYGLSRFVETLLAACGVLLVFIGHSWMYQIVDAETRFRGFMIPLVGYAVAFSSLGQMGALKLSSKRKKWILVSNESECSVIKRELGNESLTTKRNCLICNTDQIGERFRVPSGEGLSIGVGNLQTSDQELITRLLRLRENGEQIVPLLSWCEQELQRIPPELIQAKWLIQAEGFGLRPGSLNWRVKRLYDVCGAAALLIISTPLLILGGLLVWLEDRGPVFYCQIRSGLYGRPISIWKLRSMRVNAEALGAQWASQRDPRITNVGRILRATRIDELPQLISVINGDLSLIGPRPERPEIEQDLERLIPHYRIRHWIRPGLSGWAQVCYPYGASVEDSRMKLSYDLYYLRNSSLFLDFLITLKTIRLVSGAKGASPKAPQ
ncbi:sugar transferase [Synechococcus sp. A10-1-5-1]|uniref:sugar transferase n=1 Tax=Synechococcus sp. A10-1-5-1 TaxID=2936507 RepID=UPI002001D69C|nr:sugar transferase [Synechococcus sp. A10-1-5-1]UPM49208.1 sugar transferase [Synechococcus sp. A10-1-5-1]